MAEGDTPQRGGSEIGRLKLEVEELHKSYGPTRALDGLTLEARAGEIVGIAGPNGAGKSTFLRILSGEEVPDSGVIRLGGELWSGRDQPERIAFVHQEVRLFPNLTVAENLLIGRDGDRIKRPRIREREAAVLEGLGLDSVAHLELGRCSLVIQQLTEIARALVREEEGLLFLFDEPNSALSEAESAHLFEHVRAVRDLGKLVLFVSHRLAELAEHCDRVVMIRDGRCATVLEGEAVTETTIARELVVDHEIVDTDITRLKGPAEVSDDREPVLEVASWSHPGGMFSDIAFRVHPGEILALVGVEGSGVRELIRSLTGLGKAVGHIAIGGVRGSEHVRRKTMFLPAERTASLFSNFSVGQNLVSRLGRPKIASTYGYLLVRRIAQAARQMMRQYRVQAHSDRQPVTSLSGGNRQKVAIASAMASEPDVLVLEEPTRGVDVGSKAEIYDVLRDFVQAGKGVVMFCTEPPEVFELADRVLVVSEGNVVGEFQVHEQPSLTSLAEAIAECQQ